MANKNKKAARAMKDVHKAIRSGDLVRTDSCDLCPRKEMPRIANWPWRPIIVAHHYKGYDFPLDVWWVCQSCNVILGNRTDLDKAQAKVFVAHRRKLAKKNNGVTSKEGYGTSFDDWMAKNRKNLTRRLRLKKNLNINAD